MAVSTIEATFPCEGSRVWDIVTSLDNYFWRSDLDRIEVFEAGRKFVEYTKDGYATTFTVTAIDPCRRWEFDMENENMEGHWTGLFSCGGSTTVRFTEDVRAKKFYMKPFVAAYLRRQQKIYMRDLRKELER